MRESHRGVLGPVGFFIAHQWPTYYLRQHQVRGRYHVLGVLLRGLQRQPTGFAVRADFRRLYPANAKTQTCCPSDDNRTKVTNSVTSARSLWWHVGPYFWPADLTRTANPTADGSWSGIWVVRKPPHVMKIKPDKTKTTEITFTRTHHDIPPLICTWETGPSTAWQRLNCWVSSSHRTLPGVPMSTIYTESAQGGSTC